MKIILAFIFLTSVVTSCNAKNDANQAQVTENMAEAEVVQSKPVTVTGKITNAPQGQQIFLQVYPLASPGQQPQQQIIDTTMIQPDGSFTLQGTLDQEHIVIIGTDNAHVTHLVMDGGDYTFNTDYNNFSNYTITNSPESYQLKEFVETISTNFNAINQINQQIAAATRANESKEKLTQMHEEMNAKYEENFNYIKNFIKNADNDVVALLAADVMDLAAEYTFLKDYSRKALAKNPNSKYAKHLSAKVQDYGNSLGQPAPEIKLPSPDGDSIALSSLKGKLVLLDFWAAWCGPCRRENPNVVRIYDKYKDKGFTVYSVSLDKDKAKWMQAIEQDNLKWDNHVSELLFWQGKAHQQYGVNSIPATFLINEKGEIIGKNLRGYALEKRIAEILDKK